MSGYTDPALTARLTDPARLRGVDATRLIGARPIESLERLASAATRLLGVPIALVTLVDERRQWFAGLAGLTGWAAEARETPLSHSFCKHVVGDGAPLIVVNATEHVLVRDNRAVFELGVRAYAGVPLTTSDGLALGSFCAIDTKPREWTSDEIEALRDLARVAMAEVEQRIALETLRTREERLTLALEGAGEGVWDWDVATGRVDYSARWCAMLGYLPEEVPRAFEAFERALHPEDRERAVRALTRHLDGGVPRYESEHRLVRKDGTWCWVLDRGQVMARDENGRPQRVLGTITDVSARRTAEDALRTSEAQLSAIIASALDAIITVDEEQRIALFNRAAESTFGLRAENAIGQPLDILIPARFRNAHGQHVREFSATGVASRTMMHPDGLVGLRADGSEFPIEASISQLAAGGRRLFTVILRDISARQQAESERARAEAALRTSEAHYRAVLDALPVGVFVADAGGRLEATNRRAVEIWGGSPETSGIPDYAMYRAWWPDTKVPLRPEDWALARALVRGERCDGERIEIERFDGRRAMILNHAAPMYDGSGRLTGAVVAISDITAQTEADEERGAALRRSEERYAMAARAASAAIWDWDLASGRVDWGEGAREIFGHHEDFAPSFSWWASTVHPDDLERVIASIAAAVAEGSTAREWREEYRLRRGDGTWMEVVDRGYVSRESDGRATRMIGAIEDVTASRRLEARLRQAQKMEAMGQLAGGVAHDFNNLLTVIGAGLEFALDGIPLDAAARSDLEECQRAAERATTLVRQLLTFSRKQPVRPQVLRLGDLVRGAERLLRRVIGEEILLDVHIDAPGAGVYADPGQLEQVLMNLAVNARDAMLTARHGYAGGGGTLTIEVQQIVFDTEAAAEWDGVTSGAWVRLRVTDTGHGMDAETRARLFEPFFTTKDVGYGTGLGLATVFGIVQRSGGTVHVDSTPGHGTTFTMHFPAADVIEPAPTEPSRPTTTTDRGGTILLVEDERPVREVAKRMLERAGFAVLEARHALDALEIWRTRMDGIDAILTDLRMPGMGGREFVAVVRHDRPHLPVVFMSGYSGEGADLALGPLDAFVEKPFTTETLVAALARVRSGAAR